MCHFKARIASLLVTTTAINMIPTQGTARIEFFEKVPTMYSQILSTSGAKSNKPKGVGLGI